MDKYNIILENVGENKVKLIELYQKLSGADLKNAKEKIDSVPCVLLENLTKEDAEKIALQLKGNGANVRVEQSEKPEEEEAKAKIPVQEYEYHAEERQESSRSKKAENTVLGALEKISGFITSAVGIIAFILLLIDYNGLEDIKSGVIKIFTFLFIVCLLWFCVLKRYVTYFANDMENTLPYEKEQYETEQFFELIRDNLSYEGIQKLQLDEKGQCVAICKFGTHQFVYDEEKEKISVTYECGKTFPKYPELCNLLEANCIAKTLKDHIYVTSEADVEKEKLEKIYRLSRLGKLTPIYVIIGIILLVGPKGIKKATQAVRYPEIKAVQENELPILGEAPVQKVLENFFGDPEWRFESDGDGKGYVIFGGTAIQVSNDLVRDFEIYFRTKRVRETDIQFEIQKITMEGEELSEDEMLGFLLLLNAEYVDSTSDYDSDPMNEEPGDDVIAKEDEIKYTEVTSFAGLYSDAYITVSISQWSDMNFENIEPGEVCAYVTFSDGENYLEAALIKQGYNLFTIEDPEDSYYYGKMYITEDSVEISDSGDMGIDGVYALDYRYES